MTRRKTKPMCVTPWGMADSEEDHGPGIIFLTTPSHGGFFVEEPERSKIPLEWREASFDGQGKRGWFEEDCDYCFVVLTFPDRFPPGTVKAAEGSFDHWYRNKGLVR